MLRIAFLTSVLFLGSFAAGAEERKCVPVVDLANQAISLKIPAGAIKIYDLQVMHGYASAMGLPIPAGAKPTGLLIVVGLTSVFFGMIEEGDCVRYAGTAAFAVHKKAIDKANASI